MTLMVIIKTLRAVFCDKESIHDYECMSLLAPPSLIWNWCASAEGASEKIWGILRRNYI